MPPRPQSTIYRLLHNPNLSTYITVLVTLASVISTIIFAVHWYFTVENALNDLNELKKAQDTFSKELSEVKTELKVQIRLSEREIDIKSSNKEK